MTRLQKILLVVLVLVLIVTVGLGVYYWRIVRSSQVPIPPEISSEALLPPEAFVSPTESLDNTHFIVGNFQGWEEIKGSQDRYILLTNPETKGNYPKIKVVLESSNVYENNDFWEGLTAFMVEKTEEEDNDLGYLNDFTLEEIDKLIKKGDLVKVVFEKEAMIAKMENAEDLETKDLEGTDFLALSLSIKRPEGKVEVEKELGRKIQKL